MEEEKIITDTNVNVFSLIMMFVSLYMLNDARNAKC